MLEQFLTVVQQFQESSNYFTPSVQTIDQFVQIYEHLDNVVDYSEIKDDLTWSSRNLIYYPNMMLGYLLQLEQNLLGTNQQYLADYQLNLASNDPMLIYRIDTVYQLYRDKNVTLEKLTKWIGMLQCLNMLTSNDTFNVAVHFENYRYFGDPQYIRLPFCRADMITQLGFGMVCTKLFKEPNVPIRPGYNYFTIYEGLLVDPNVPVSFDPGNDASLFALFDATQVIPNLQWHLDLQGRDVVPVDRSGIFSWNPSENVVLDISVSSEYRLVNRRSYACSNAEETQYECEWRN